MPLAGLTIVLLNRIEEINASISAVFHHPRDMIVVQDVNTTDMRTMT
jgi:hypothetical protein